MDSKSPQYSSLLTLQSLQSQRRRYQPFTSSGNWHRRHVFVGVIYADRIQPPLMMVFCFHHFRDAPKMPTRSDYFHRSGTRGVVGVRCVVVAAIAVRVHVPEVGRAANVRGAKPPVGGVDRLYPCIISRIISLNILKF